MTDNAKTIAWLPFYCHQNGLVNKMTGTDRNECFRLVLKMGFDFTRPNLFTLAAMNLMNQLTAQQLRQAADLKDKITALQGQLSQLLGASDGGVISSPLKIARPARKKISAAGIAKIRAAQKARWAKIKGAEVEKAPVPKPATKKRTISATARVKMADAAKARWAKVKAAKK